MTTETIATSLFVLTMTHGNYRATRRRADLGRR